MNARLLSYTVFHKDLSVISFFDRNSFYIGIEFRRDRTMFNIKCKVSEVEHQKIVDASFDFKSFFEKISNAQVICIPCKIIFNVEDGVLRVLPLFETMNLGNKWWLSFQICQVKWE